MITDSKIIAEIFSKLVRFKNGVVADAMRDRGIVYEKNYGVSIFEIKKVAAEYFPNHALACELFMRKERELKLAAVFVESAANVTLQQIDDWSALFTNVEITDVVCRNLFSQTPFAATKIEEWRESGNDFFVQASFNLLSKIENADELFLKNQIQKISNISLANPNVQFAAIQALTRLAVNYKNFRNDILQLARNFSISNNENQKFIGTEVLEFL